MDKCEVMVTVDVIREYDDRRKILWKEIITKDLQSLRI